MIPLASEDSHWADEKARNSFYSTYGHITQLAEKVVEGVRAAGAEPVVYQM